VYRDTPILLDEERTPDPDTRPALRLLEGVVEKEEGDRKMALKGKDLFEGFDQEKLDRWNKEVEEKYDTEKVAESKRNIQNMGKDGFREVKERGAEITLAISSLMDKGSQAPEVQSWIKEHHLWIENFYTCSAEMYNGLGQLYIQNPEFTEYYEKIKPGLAAFMAEAMGYYTDHSLMEEA